jgi:hypothetical protein
MSTRNAALWPAALALAMVLAGTRSPGALAQDIVIGTGSTSGVYYPLGRAICRLVNRYAAGLRCEARPTAGSLSNLNNVRTNALEIGIAQSDWQFHAVQGSREFEFMDGDFGNLRAIFSAHGEPFTLVARRDARIGKLEDLKGRRVNIGNPESGQRATMEVVMRAKGWTKSDFALAEELPASQQSLALCHGRVEAMIYTVGHPNASISKATGLCDAVIVDVADKDIDELVKAKPYYAYTTIPGGMYSGTPDDVKTFGVKATLVTSSDVSEDLIYAATKAVFEHLDELRRMHPAFGTLDPRKMISEGLTAPLHAGAERYYRERGWM